MHRLARSWLEKLEPVYSVFNRASGGRLEVVRSAIKSFSDCRAAEAAAGIAFFGLFSLFPFLLFLIAGASYILEREYAKQQLLFYIQTIIPISRDVIASNIDRVLEQRPTFGLIALLGLLWSSSGVFNSLAVNINRAWSEAHVRSFLHSRLIALGMVAVLVLLLVLSALTSAVLNLVAEARLPVFGNVLLYESLPWKIFSTLIPLLLRLLLFWGVYLWVPAAWVRPRAAFWGALVAAVFWELITDGFTFYLSSGLAQFDRIYGSLGALIALMLWIYLSSAIALFGGHLTACLNEALSPGSKTLVPLILAGAKQGQAAHSGEKQP
jgi:membrane protein